MERRWSRDKSSRQSVERINNRFIGSGRLWHTVSPLLFITGEYFEQTGRERSRPGNIDRDKRKRNIQPHRGEGDAGPLRARGNGPQAAGICQTVDGRRDRAQDRARRRAEEIREKGRQDKACDKGYPAHGDLPDPVHGLGPGFRRLQRGGQTH